MSLSLVKIGPAMPEVINAVIEIPKGSRNKYEYDPGLDLIRLDRVLHSPVAYPTHYGFIPETHAQDGDPLDVMAFISEPVFPGCVVTVRPIALARMTDEKGDDPKILAVAEEDPHYSEINDLGNIPDSYQREIRHFFEVYKQLENKPVKFLGWNDRDEALRLIKASHEAYLKQPVFNS